jgi:hypothetical protein
VISDIFVTTFCTTKIDGVAVNDLFNALSFRNIGFAERILHHNVIHRSEVVSPIRFGYRRPRTEEALQNSVSQIDKEAEE